MSETLPADSVAARPRILIVDDDPDLLDAMQRRLGSQFEVTAAANGNEALRLVTSHGPFAVVVTDLHMPGMDGLTLLFCVRVAAPETVAIVLTGYADLESAITAVNQGNAFRYLTKPCAPGMLKTALEAAVERYRSIVAGRTSLLPSSSTQQNASPIAPAIILNGRVDIEIPAIRGLGIESKQVPDSLPDGITIQDRDYNVIYQNAAMLAAFGNKLGAKCYAAYEKRDAQCEGCGVQQAFLTGQPALVLRTAFDAKGGTSYWENACFPIRDDSGSIVAAAEICRSVTDRVGLEDEVKRRNIELGQINQQLQERTVELSETFQRLAREVEERERMDVELRHAQKLEAVGQLAAGIAHEINTPTQFVGDKVQFLADSFAALRQLTSRYQQAIGKLTEATGQESLAHEIREAEEEADLAYLEENIPAALHQAREGISQISAIVSAMKEFAHPDQRDKKMSDLNRGLQAALTVARNEYKLVADIETDFGEIPPVMCYIGDLNQVFLHLLVNAAHAISDVVGKSGNRGRIRVSTRREHECVRIDIADTGCGIPQDIRERIFEPFFTTKTVGRGTGQGLAISRSIVVDKHRGSLTFESEEGKGTTFTISIPISEDLAASAVCAPSDVAIRALAASLRELGSAAKPAD